MGGERFAVQYTVPAGAAPVSAMTAFDDPWDFWVYRTRLKPVEDGRKLEMRGYIGPFYRTQVWIRVE